MHYVFEVTIMGVELQFFSVGKSPFFKHRSESISMCVTSVLENKTIIILNHSHVVMYQLLQ